MGPLDEGFEVVKPDGSLLWGAFAPTESLAQARAQTITRRSWADLRRDGFRVEETILSTLKSRSHKAKKKPKRRKSMKDR